MSSEDDVRQIVNRETEAWNQKNADLLISVFHKEMVWPWPPTQNHHDPIDWVLVQGKFDANRWTRNWQNLFDTHDLVRNIRTIQKIVVSKEQDGAFAVVDIDTLWKNRSSGEEIHWMGRTCKTYALTADGWRMIHQVGVLDYSNLSQ